MILETAAADPALDPKYRDAARALALSYQNLVAIATGKEGDDPELGAVINDANANARALQGLWQLAPFDNLLPKVLRSA